jgi:hypothetical protein
MAAVEGGGAAPSRSQAVADLQAAQHVQAVKLLDLLEAAKPVNLDGFVPGYGMPGGADIPKSPGLYAAALVDDVWPTDSPSGLRNTATRLEELARMHESAAETAKAQSDHVFAGSRRGGMGRTPRTRTIRSSTGASTVGADLRDGCRRRAPACGRRGQRAAEDARVG